MSRSGFRYITIPTGPPTVRRLFEIMREREISAQTMEQMAGLGTNTVERWKRYCNPSIVNLEACFNALGYQLVAVPIEAVPIEKAE